MLFSRIKLQNWRNFSEAEAKLAGETYLIGPNASGKSNFLDAFRFLRDIANPDGGGLQRAVSSRDGISKVRSLHARQRPDVIIDVDISTTDDAESPRWKYVLEFGAPVGKRESVVVKREIIWDYDKSISEPILNRPDKEDDLDEARLTQTAIEQRAANKEFRELVSFFGQISYVHLVPQLIRFGDMIGGNRLEHDPFGQGFLEQIAKAPSATRKARLSHMEKALKAIIPQFSSLDFERDEITGRPHLEIKYVHRRPQGARQQEDQFSDGTLRLIGMLWSLQDSNKVLLLEEPELSLNNAIVAQIPKLIARARREKHALGQAIITTHSEVLLSNPGIGPRSILILEAAHEGTVIKAPDEADIAAMNAGLSPADTVLKRVQDQMGQAIGLASL